MVTRREFFHSMAGGIWTHTIKTFPSPFPEVTFAGLYWASSGVTSSAMQTVHLARVDDGLRPGSFDEYVAVSAAASDVTAAGTSRSGFADVTVHQPPADVANNHYIARLGT